MTSFRSRCQVVSTELFPPVVIVPSAKIQFSKFWGENLSSQNAISACGYPCPGKVRVDLMVDGGNPFLLMINILWPLTVCN